MFRQVSSERSPSNDETKRPQKQFYISYVSPFEVFRWLLSNQNLYYLTRISPLRMQVTFSLRFMCRYKNVQGYSSRWFGYLLLIYPYGIQSITLCKDCIPAVSAFEKLCIFTVRFRLSSLSDYSYYVNDSNRRIIIPLQVLI